MCLRALVFGVSLTLVGCSSVDVQRNGSTATTAQPDPVARPATSAAAGSTGPTTNISCSLLTAAEITDATGTPVGSGSASAVATGADTDGCEWFAVDGTGFTQLVLISADVYEQNRTSNASLYGDATEVEIRGADAAYTAFDGVTLGMRVDGRFVQVSVIDGTDQSRAVLALAELAATRL